MIVKILGSAAGGGVPQWNCGCINCTRARRGELPSRMQSSIAIGSGGEWLLVNASVDLPHQLAATPELWPNALRATPFRAVLLTDANVDHTAGLGELRQGPDPFVVVSSKTTKELLAGERAYERFDRAPHRWVAAEPDGSDLAASVDPVLAERFEVRAWNVPGLLPGYAGRRPQRGAVLAYELRERGGGATVLAAPVFADVDEVLAAAIGRADLALLDGTFFSDDEMQALGLPAKPARALGHLPVGGPDGSLARSAHARGRRVFVHLNNTNPMLDSDSIAFASVREADCAVAGDRETYEVS
ncbi:MAG TPA: MBL fold metallo-hydrolase [Verrucomicrobiae bacterium]|nr:MBL fold metallo-hydrolase [Verrucomicrobiae bacterium]